MGYAGTKTLIRSKWIIIYIFFIADNIYYKAPERNMFRMKLKTTASFEVFLIAVTAKVKLFPYLGSTYNGNSLTA